MSQPPSDQDRPGEQDQDQPPSKPAGKKPSIWPSGNEPPAWPASSDSPAWPSGNESPAWPSSGQAPSWPSGNQPPAWPSGPDQGAGQGHVPGQDRDRRPRHGQGRDQGQPSLWPSADQPPAWPAPGQQSPLPSPAWPSADQSPPDQSLPNQPSAGQPPRGPGFTYGYGRRQPRFRRRFPVRAVIVLALFIAFGFAVRGLTSHHQAGSVPSPPASVGLRTGLQAPPGAVGASFRLDDGAGAAYQVTLVRVIDPARGANQLSTPDGGKRFVGLVFRIKGVTGSPQGEDADNDAVLAGANGRHYSAALDRIAGYTNFDDGAIHVKPGQTVTGAVAFQIPNGVTVSTIHWTALSGFGPMVEWNVQS